MGIGLVDPILKPIADDLSATPSQVSLLFTSYNGVMAVAMLITGYISSRLGAKRTLLLGLAIIIVGAGLAGSQNAVPGIVAFRALWGLGNALFIATALATIVSASVGSVGQAIILYEAALGLGIAAGPLLGGFLGSLSWRFPFFGVSALMTIALLATAFTLPKTPPHANPTPISAPIKALRHRGLLTVGLTAFLYNFGFFTLLAFTPFPLNMDAHGVGWVFFGWGLLLALTSVVVAPWVQRRLGTAIGIGGALGIFMLLLLVMGLFTENRAVLVTCTVLAGGTWREQHAHHRDRHEDLASRAGCRVVRVQLRPIHRRCDRSVAGRRAGETLGARPVLRRGRCGAGSDGGPVDRPYIHPRPGRRPEPRGRADRPRDRGRHARGRLSTTRSRRLTQRLLAIPRAGAVSTGETGVAAFARTGSLAWILS